MTHAELIRLARNWLWALPPTDERRRVAVVGTEISSPHAAESPDVFGIANDGTSFLIECKVSRADFLADRNKEHRSAERLLGTYRWFCGVSGIIEPHELPKGWGLIQVVAGKLVERIPAPTNVNVDHEAEKALLVSVLRNVWRGGRVRGVGMRAYSRTKAQDSWVWETPLSPLLDEQYPKFTGSIGVDTLGGKEKGLSDTRSEAPLQSPLQPPDQTHTTT